MSYVLLGIGVALLLVCGDALVRGAVALSIKLGIPTLVIGLTVVAFGTSAPELVVSLRAALSGSPGLAIGNVVGSNIANILLVLGLPALIAATDCDQPFIRRNMFYVIGTSLLFIGLCYYGPLAFWQGLLMFLLLIVFLLEQARRAEQRHRAATTLGHEAIEMIDGVDWLPEGMLKIGLNILVGLIGLPVGASMTVAGAVSIAQQFGISEATIGLTIVALGTSLPELATTIPAAMRGHAGLALGNVLGSNLFNILAIMGVTAMVTPVPVPEQLLRVDLWVMLAACLALIPFVLPRRRITRIPAMIFVFSYVAYIYFALVPGASATFFLQATPLVTN